MHGGWFIWVISLIGTFIYLSVVHFNCSESNLLNLKLKFMLSWKWSEKLLSLCSLWGTFLELTSIRLSRQDSWPLGKSPLSGHSSMLFPNVQEQWLELPASRLSYPKPNRAILAWPCWPRIFYRCRDWVWSSSWDLFLSSQFLGWLMRTNLTQSTWPHWPLEWLWPSGTWLESGLVSKLLNGELQP